MFKFSVIIPIYNVEKYLYETIESVINQSIGFKKNVQLILVNDGSPDNSREICLKYKKLYPDNVIYVEKENGGVSSARNEGMKYISGKYVNFLDADDKWDKNAFKRAYRFFEKHFDEIDVLACRVKFFEAKENYHPTDYKFSAGTRIADLNSEEEYFSVQLTVATTFVKASAIKDLNFNSALKFGEDSIYVNTLILNKCKMGFIREAEYLYRRRLDESSAVNVQTFQKTYYVDTPREFHLKLIELSVKKYGKVLPYFQAVIAYDLMWRFGIPQIHETLNEEEYNDFCKTAGKVLSYIDDSIILNNPVHKSIIRKSEAIELKKHLPFFSQLELVDGVLMYGDNEILTLSRNKTRCCSVVGLKIEGGSVTLEMLVAQWLFNVTEDGGSIFLKVGKKTVYPEIKPFNTSKVNTSMGMQNYYRLCTFNFNLSVKTGSKVKLKPFMLYGEKSTPVSMSYGKFIPSANAFAPAYQIQGKYAIRYLRTVINIYAPKSVKKERRRLERKCISFLFKKGKLKEALIRLKLPLFKRLNKKKGEIWLVSDRIDNAGDNGEVFFRYLCNNKPKGIRPVFVIGKSAEKSVIDRLKRTGEVVFFESREYPLFFLASKKIISSSGADFTVNPFGKEKKYFHSLFNFSFYYLQHGVTCADLSVWLNRFNKNIKLFFVSGKKEKNAISNSDYLYEENRLVLSGQARFDALYENTKKQILILPTWRRSIKQSYDEKTSSVYFDGFKYTEYFKFYNSLINDKKLLEAMRKHGYKGIFCLHPIHSKQSVDFKGNDIFSVNSGYVDYNKVFAESAAMITDYSSVLFDFAYLRKPVVYAQFDKEEFFEGQIYDEGYFKYESDGFGKVCYNYSDTVSEIIRLVESGCENSEEYIKRVDSFFAYNDKNNSKRILKAILNDN